MSGACDCSSSTQDKVRIAQKHEESLVILEEMLSVRPPGWTKKRNQEKVSTRARTERSSVDGIGRTTGSCNLASALTRTQHNACLYPPTAKRRSPDIPARTGSVFTKKPRRCPLFSCFLCLISINPRPSHSYLLLTLSAHSAGEI